MPDITPTIDARMLKVGNTWAGTVGDGVTATSVQTSAAFHNAGINTIDLTAFNTTQVERFYLEFDTSGITVAPQSATLKIYGKSSGAAGVIGVQASFASAGAIVVGDWDSWNEASPVNYTDSIAAGAWSTSGYNTFTLTAAALSAMASLSEFQIIFLELDNDYDQTSAGSGLSHSSGYYTRNESGKEPTLTYTAAAADVPPPKMFTKVDGGSLKVNGGKVKIGE